MKSPKSTAVLIALLSLGLAACEKIQIAPKTIEADGEAYLACTGLVRISDESGMLSSEPIYTISYTDSGRMSHTIWGIRKLRVSDPPKTTLAPFPNRVPDPALATDEDGKKFTNGSIYTWPDGSKAQLSDGMWKPVKVSSACNQWPR